MHIAPQHKIVPSYPAPSFAELTRLFDTLKGVTDEVQVDMVDGAFAPSTSWPFTEDDPAAALTELAPYTRDFTIEMDCMIEDPERWLDRFTALGIKRVVVHLGSTDAYEEIIEHARAHRYAIGLALTNDVPLAALDPFVERIDFVQLMGIREVGRQGRPFDEETVARAAKLRAHYPSLDIAVDGGVNERTIPPLLAAGVNRFAPGSDITTAADPAAAFRTLSALISNQT